jgi:tetratricopeptide (TPR) repeat protein
MQYQKIKSGETVIEFHNNWLGEETVIVKGKILSKKSSFLGTSHDFSVVENKKTVRFILTSKLDANMNVLLDLRRNGKVVQENIAVQYGSPPRSLKNPDKQKGIQKLQEYQLQEAVELLKKALLVNAEDPELYFHLACAYSVLERPLEGFEALREAVAYNLQDTEMILQHDMLAFLRLHDAFEGFLDSGFKHVERGDFE